MVKEKIGFEVDGKKFALNVKKCNFIERFVGLMFKRKEKAEALLFDFGKKTKIAIHSFFVFFSFIALWLDDGNKCIEIKIVKSFKPIILPKKPFSKLIEIPFNSKYNEICEILVGMERFK